MLCGVEPRTDVLVVMQGLFGGCKGIQQDGLLVMFYMLKFVPSTAGTCRAGLDSTTLIVSLGTRSYATMYVLNGKRTGTVLVPGVGLEP